VAIGRYLHEVFIVTWDFAKGQNLDVSIAPPAFKLDGHIFSLDLFVSEAILTQTAQDAWVKRPVEDTCSKKVR
jgi:hypothetical protein